jgi:hypothetical protein
LQASLNFLGRIPNPETDQHHQTQSHTLLSTPLISQEINVVPGSPLPASLNFLGRIPKEQPTSPPSSTIKIMTQGNEVVNAENLQNYEFGSSFDVKDKRLDKVAGTAYLI